ncbi:MAG: phytanoyl-CoA dioxygenase family protein [Chloroflexi bacterium]|nr:phytanoyl-CoA dioxygenase family protein [Chloroflexota bacterium]
MLTIQHQEFFAANGYAIVRQLFTPEEVARYRDHYMALRAAGKYPGDSPGIDIGSQDPLKRYPRMIHMHRWDPISLSWLIDARINACLTGLLGAEPLAVQSMLYFKPPGARGQALHQDNYYLKVQPGTCMATWLALDDCDEANGCLRLVPGSHTWPILCTTKADITQSFTDVTVPVPDGMVAEPLTMAAGDVVFFNGSLVHGSYPNDTSDRFRRALIGHYIQGEAQKVAKFFHPVLRMNGESVVLEINPGGSECGVWVDGPAGEPVIEMAQL